jgi:hypothetical protein
MCFLVGRAVGQYSPIAYYRSRGIVTRRLNGQYGYLLGCCHTNEEKVLAKIRRLGALSLSPQKRYWADKELVMYINRK